jgi:putative SOS response-associated peptidase YedK
MCNDYRYRLPAERLIEEFSQNKLRLFSPQGTPNIEPRDDIRIRDRAPVVRMHEGQAELLQMTWAWTGPTGKPVFNFRGENRRFNPAERVLIPADGFYEFTDPEPGQKLKTKWLFTMRDIELFCIAGVVKNDAFAMLTVDPGPDMAPYHNRQIVVLEPGQWQGWLTSAEPESEFIKPAPAGLLQVCRASAVAQPPLI